MITNRGTKGVLALAVLAALSLAVPAVASESTSPKSKDSGFGTTPITDPRQDGLYAAQDNLQPLMDEYRDVLGETRWDMDSQTFTVELVDSVRGGEARAAFSQVNMPVKLAFASVQFSKAELLAAADHLVRSASSWAPGLTGLSYASADTALGTVILGVKLGSLNAWRAAASKTDAVNVPISVRGEAEVGVDFQSRYDDFAPWSGGLALYGSKLSGPRRPL